MKPYLFIIISVLFFGGCSQKGIDDKNKRNENWIWWVSAKTGLGEWVQASSGPTDPNGTYIHFYSNGNVYNKIKIRDAQVVDTIFYFDLNGNPNYYKIIGINKEAKYYYNHDGLFKHYDITCKSILAEGIVQNHAEGDKWKSYYENGKPSTIWNYDKDTGWIANYYENGQIKDSSLHRGQSPRFVCKSWYPNGQIKEIHGWKFGLQDGVSMKYYENGKMEDSSFLVNGKPEGIVKRWFEDGKLKVTGHYMKGVEDGQWIFYFKNGKAKSSRNYKNGKFHGDQIDFYESGHIKKTGFFNNGVLVRKFIIYNEKGRPIKISI